MNRRIWCQKNPVRLWALGTFNGHLYEGYDVQVTVDELLEKARVTLICPYCGIKLWFGRGEPRSSTASLDRINNEQFLTNDNTQIICLDCNNRKGTLTHSELVEYCKRITNQFSQQELKSWEGLAEKLANYVNRQKKEEEDRTKMYDILDKQSPGWNEPYFKSLGFCRRPLTKEDRKKIEDMLDWLRVNPDTDNVVVV